MGETLIGVDSSVGEHIVENEQLNNPIHSMEFADQTARENATEYTYQEVLHSFSDKDLHKVSLQLDNDSLWQVVGVSPLLWKQIDASATSNHDRGHLLGSALDHTDVLVLDSKPGDILVKTAGGEYVNIHMDSIRAGLISDTDENFITDENGNYVTLE